MFLPRRHTHTQTHTTTRRAGGTEILGMGTSISIYLYLSMSIYLYMVAPSYRESAQTTQTNHKQTPAQVSAYRFLFYHKTIKDTKSGPRSWKKKMRCRSKDCVQVQDTRSMLWMLKWMHACIHNHINMTQSSLSLSLSQVSFPLTCTECHTRL